MGLNLRWRKGTRTHDLEWFGPPERNTLRPLGDVLFLVVYNLSSAGALLSPSLSPSSGRPPFIDQGVRIHWTLGPRQVGPTYCAAYCAEYSNGYSGYESFLRYASMPC